MTTDLRYTREPLEVRGGVARFIADTYAESFGDQWKRWRRVQLDSVTGKPISRARYLESGWPERLDGERVLEAGCGAGRFTEVLLSTGAEVVAVDASSAVDVCFENNGPHERLTVFQADLNDLPFEPGQFDRVYCFGVLQHTPDPRASFLSLVPHLRPGGDLACDVYAHPGWPSRWSSKYLWRWLTTRIPRRTLARIVEWYVPKWLPIDTRLSRVPKLGAAVTSVVPCWNYTGIFDLDRDQLRAWAVLDTFDALSPRYDVPQTIASVEEWTRAAGLVDVSVRPGGNGILVNGRRPT